MSYSLFGMVAAPVAGMLLHRLPFTITIISFSILLVTGGMVYALARSVWMAFVGYGLTGAGVSFGTITIHTYMGEMGDIMDEIRKKQGKKPRKFLLYNIYSFTLTGAFMFPFCKNTLFLPLLLEMFSLSLQLSTRSWHSLIFLPTTGLDGCWLP